jgi:VWFA-related protein
MVRLKTLSVISALLLFSSLATAQSSLPDAPAAQTPETKKTLPAASSETPAAESSKPQQVEPAKPADTDNAFPEEESRKAAEQAQQVVEAGQAPEQEGSQRDQLPVFRSSTNFVLVPVTVKKDGHMVRGLASTNFQILENETPQKIRFFTSDPFPLSAAVVVDVGMADIALKKVAETFASLQGSFSEFDEAAVYSYGNTVKQQEDFAGALGDKVAKALKRTGQIYGRGAGPNIYDSPMTASPSVNGRPIDPASPTSNMRNMRDDEPSRVLNDAILRAAIDLSRRDRNRRKVIILISDGREDRSTASYADVLKVLLTNDVTLYAIAVDTAAIPGYSKLSSIRLPRQGYGNILPKYASATGGNVFTDFTSGAIEKVYAQLTDEARNQYTIGYNAPKSLSRDYRRIEVRVDQKGLKVVARDGYYPMPPAKK